MRGQRILRALITPLPPVCELRKGAAAEVTWGGVCSPTTFVALVPGRFVGLVQLEEPHKEDMRTRSACFGVENVYVHDTNVQALLAARP